MVGAELITQLDHDAVGTSLQMGIYLLGAEGMVGAQIVKFVVDAQMHDVIPAQSDLYIRSFRHMKDTPGNSDALISLAHAPGPGLKYMVEINKAVFGGALNPPRHIPAQGPGSFSQPGRIETMQSI